MLFVFQCRVCYNFFKIVDVKVSSKLSPTIGGKKEYFNVGDEEVARCLGPPEFMAPTLLGKYLNKYKQKLKFCMQYIVKNRVNNEAYQTNTKMKHRYNYFSNLNKGE